MDRNRQMATRTSGPTARTADSNINEAHRQVPTHIGSRRLIAAGIKRGNGQLVVKAVA